MTITRGERTACLDYIIKMAYAKSEVEYNSLYTQFLNFAPQPVKNYFDGSWHPIRDEWIMRPKFATGNFLNATNNRLESLNDKLKQVITKFSLRISLRNFLSSCQSFKMSGLIKHGALSERLESCHLRPTHHILLILIC